MLLPALCIAAGGALSTSPVAAQVDHEDVRRGVILDGLERVADSDYCRGNFRLASQSHRGIPVCTHGPDPAPEGVDVRAEPVPPLAPAGTALATQVPCVGSGSDGYRVHLIYARAADKADGYAQWLPSLQQYAARADDVFNLSAAETGGTRHLRFVHDASCVPVIDNVVLTTRGDDNFDSMLTELRGKGYARSDRKYLVWMDANVYCGIAQVYYDDSPGQENTSNGASYIPGEVARVDKGCWGLPNLVEAHELVHVLGGVQTSAPNATPGSHCTDNYDRLCYDDGTGFATIVCGDSGHENRLDCNHDDYYSTAPPPGSYLDTHWNVADSRFLTGAGTSGPGATTTTVPPPPSTTTTISRFPWWWPTTTTRPPSVTTTTRPPSATTTTTRPPTTTTATPPTGTRPSAPLNLIASQPPGAATGIALSWSPPSSPGGPPFTTYRIYRGTGPSGLTKVADVPAGTTAYVDGAATSRLVFWYYVTAVNAAGEGPPSSLVRMIAK
ncbi:MAG: hypothetical protein ACRD2W_20755 [Acidimicrobiales bacterium]